MVAKRRFATSISGALMHKVLSSKIVLFGGLVALVIFTCPGARGAGLSDVDAAPLSIVGESFGLAADVDPSWLHATNAGPSSAKQASERRNQVSRPAPSAQGGRPTAALKLSDSTRVESAAEEVFQHTSRAIPMMVGPILSDPTSAASYRPMVGAAVGVNTWKERFSR